MQTGVQTNVASLQATAAGLQASVAELRATLKTVYRSVCVVLTLATVFFAAGKALHWF